MFIYDVQRFSNDVFKESTARSRSIRSGYRNFLLDKLRKIYLLQARIAQSEVQLYTRSLLVYENKLFMNKNKQLHLKSNSFQLFCIRSTSFLHNLWSFLLSSSEFLKMVIFHMGIKELFRSFRATWEWDSVRTETGTVLSYLR